MRRARPRRHDGKMSDSFRMMSPPDPDRRYNRWVQTTPDGRIYPNLHASTPRSRSSPDPRTPPERSRSDPSEGPAMQAQDVMLLDIPIGPVEEQEELPGKCPARPAP